MDDKIINEYCGKGIDGVSTSFFISETIKVMINIFQLLNCFRHGQRWHVKVFRANNLNNNENVRVMLERKGIQRHAVEYINKKKP